MYTTYLLGAGASANSIPVVEKFNEDFINAFKNFENEYKVNVANDRTGSNFDNKEKLRLIEVSKGIKKDLRKISVELIKHRTIDTLAKRFALTNDSRLVNLKNLLAVYFWMKQVGEGSPIDNRYDFFLANILETENNQIKWPSSIKILSWNYDLQLEMAMSLYEKSNSIRRANQRLSSIPDINDPNIIQKNLADLNLIKLNGVAGLYTDEKDEPFFPADEININEFVLHIAMLNFYQKIKSPTSRPYLTFAWEKNEISETIKSKSLEVLAKTQKLIIVGYSFPYYNREIDSFILSQMMSANEIIIQDIYPQVIKDRLLSRLTKSQKIMYDSKIRMSDDTNNFKLPED